MQQYQFIDQETEELNKYLIAKKNKKQHAEIEKYLTKNCKQYFENTTKPPYEDVIKILLFNCVHCVNIKTILEDMEIYIKKNYPELSPGLEEFYHDPKGGLFDLVSDYKYCYEMPVESNIFYLKITPELWKKKINELSLKMMMNVMYPKRKDYIACHVSQLIFICKEEIKSADKIMELRKSGLFYQQICDYLLCMKGSQCYFAHSNNDFDVNDILYILNLDFNLEKKLQPHYVCKIEEKTFNVIHDLFQNIIERYAQRYKSIIEKKILNKQVIFFNKSKYKRYFDLNQEFIQEIK